MFIKISRWWSFLNPAFCGSDTGCDSSDSGTSSGGDDSSGMGGGGWSSSNSYGQDDGWGNDLGNMTGMEGAGNSSSGTVGTVSNDVPDPPPSNYNPAEDDDTNLTSIEDMYSMDDYSEWGVDDDEDYDGIRDQLQDSMPVGPVRDYALGLAQDQQWNEANTFGEYGNYFVDHHLGKVVGLLNPVAGLVTTALQDHHQGYSPNQIAANTFAGVAGPMIGRGVGQATYGLTGNAPVSAATGLLASNYANQHIASSPTMANQGTLDDESSLLADRGTLVDSGGNPVSDGYGGTVATGGGYDHVGGESSPATVAQSPDPYTTAGRGFGNIRNRQFRSRYYRG